MHAADIFSKDAVGTKLQEYFGCLPRGGTKKYGCAGTKVLKLTESEEKNYFVLSKTYTSILNVFV